MTRGSRRPWAGESTCRSAQPGGAASRTPRAAERGQAMIEFALIFLLFATVIFAAFEFSRAILVYTTVTNSARIGARAAIVNGSMSGGAVDIVQTVKDYAAAANLNPASVAVSVDHPARDSAHPAGCNAPGCFVRVQVSYPYNPVTFVPIGTITITASTQGVVTY